MNKQQCNSLVPPALSNVNFFIVLLLCVISIARLVSPSLNALSLYGIVPLLFVWCLSSNPIALRNKYIKIYSALVFWIFVTIVFATNLQIAFNTFKSILGGYGISVIFYSLSVKKRHRYEWWLFLCYIIVLVASIFYLHRSGAFLIDVSTERLDDDMINANALAYYLFYASIANTLMFLGEKKKGKKISIGIDLILVVITLWLSFITASRQMILIVLPFLFFALLFKILNGAKMHTKVIALVVMIFVVVGLFTSYTMALEGTFLQQRLEQDVQDDTRTMLLKDAIEVGMKYPVFGVGPGNFVLYSNDGGFSHCSYTELFACSGVLATLLYVLMVVMFALEQLKRLRTTQNRVFLFLFITSLVWSIYNVLYVFYVSPMLIAFFFLLVGYSDKLYYRHL